MDRKRNVAVWVDRRRQDISRQENILETATTNKPIKHEHWDLQ
jgi:hypothetical protein